MQLLVDRDCRLAGEIGVLRIGRDAVLAMARRRRPRRPRRPRPVGAAKLAKQFRAPSDPRRRLRPSPRSSAAGTPESRAVMPTARQIAVKRRCRRRRPWTTGGSRRTEQRPRRPAAATMMMLAHSAPGSIEFAQIGGLHRLRHPPSTRCTIACGGVDHEELRDRLAVGGDHQHEHQHVPQGEAVQRRRHPARRMHGERIERAAPARHDGAGAMELERGSRRTAARSRAG